MATMAKIAVTAIVKPIPAVKAAISTASVTTLPYPENT